VVCLYRNAPAAGLPGNVEFVQGDLADGKAYAAELAGCDTVVHLAAATGNQPPAEYWRVNRDGTETLVREARGVGVRRFLHVSTIAVKFADQSRYYYAQSKQQAEAMVAQSGMPWTIVRPTLILGKGSPVLEGFSRLAALPVVPVFGNGTTPVQPIFVDDLADCVAAMLEEDIFDGQTVEVGGPEVLTIEALLRRVRKAQGRGEARVMHLPARPIAALLGWVEPLLRPLLPFTAGQLASFTNAGTVDANPWVAHRQTSMKGVDEALQLSRL
jgi:nucleoside-diphosphate-sugar epimerase